MPATRQKFQLERWQVDAIALGEGKSKEEKDALYLKAMNEHYSQKYAGLSTPIRGASEIFARQDPRWALKHMIQEDGLTIVHGQPGSGKSFLAMEWVYALSHPDLDGWMGMKRARQFKPLYLFTEGVSGLKKRTLAWQMHNKINAPEGFIVLPDAVILNRTENPESPFTAQVSALRQMYQDEGCDMLIVDTLANTFGGNENQQVDANSYLATLRMFQELGPVVVIHHNKKGEDEFRGSTALLGAVDTMVGVKQSKHGVIDVTLTKQKDGDPAFKLSLRQREYRWKNQWNEEDGSVAFEKDDTPDTVKGMGPTAKRIYDYIAQQHIAGWDQVSVAEVARELEIDKSNLKRAVKNSGTMHLIKGEGNNFAWVALLTEDEPESL